MTGIAPTTVILPISTGTVFQTFAVDTAVDASTISIVFSLDRQCSTQDVVAVCKISLFVCVCVCACVCVCVCACACVCVCVLMGVGGPFAHGPLIGDMHEGGLGFALL